MEVIFLDIQVSTCKDEEGDLSQDLTLVATPLMSYGFWWILFNVFLKVVQQHVLDDTLTTFWASQIFHFSIHHNLLTTSCNFATTEWHLHVDFLHPHKTWTDLGILINYVTCTVVMCKLTTSFLAAQYIHTSAFYSQSSTLLLLPSSIDESLFLIISHNYRQKFYDF
jgi:hypothetical protein